MKTLVLSLVLLLQGPLVIPRRGSIAITAADATTGVVKVELYIDGKLKASSPTSFTYQFPNNVKGKHTVVAKAYDRAGNVGITTQTVQIR